MNSDLPVHHPSGISLPTSLVSVILVLLLGYLLTRLRTTKGKLPPGPKPKPIIGNLLDFPAHGTRQELHWNKYKELYGPITYLNVFGQSFIILNDTPRAKELLDKHATKWSNRPHMTFGGEMCGFQNSMLFAQHDEKFRKARKMVHNQLGAFSSLQKWNTDIDVEVRRYLLRTLEQPAEFAHHLRKEAGAIILKIVYGYNIEPHDNDTLVDLMEEVMRIFAKALVPGGWLVDAIPSLKYLPEWLPGMKFKRTAKAWHSKVIASADVPFRFTQRQIDQGIAPVSLVSESMSKLGSNVSADDIELVKWSAASMYAAGSETSASQMTMFILAMLKFPEVQRKAQAEIDTVVGTDRLPDPSDRAHLPYVEAVLKETVRWNPVGEVTPPHLSTEDDTYGEYFIPKGTMVLANVIGHYHDPSVYPDPDSFRPERYLGENPQPDPFDYLWGFGRRICPGRWLASANVWLGMSRTLAVFDISVIKGKEPTMEFVYGATVTPLPFEADIRPRSIEHEQLVREVNTSHPFPAHGDGGSL